ncbi:MAG: hypothetical protein MJZ63_00485 [Muribaculaceae bacterium]|nr:hypothetical protein [Muribaculaceae bacterium]
MIITDYYKMQELKVMKSHRFDCTASTGEYPLFEAIAHRARNGRFYCYYNGIPDSFSANAQRKADKALSNGDNISSVYIPNLSSPLIGYGDVNGTNDGLLFLFSEDYKMLEIFVARGYKNNIRNLFYLFADGELDDELARIREQAKPVEGK